MSYRLARWVSAVCALFLLCTFCAAGKDKTIRLRNETIVTHGPEGKAPGQARPGGKPGTVGAGLLVVQFQESPKPEQLQELRQMGVQMVRYVPEDAYIVRVKNVTVEQIEALAFVQYAGEYRPDHKVHGNVRKALEKPGQEELYVSVMFSPLATKAEVDQARREFRSIRQESHLRQGAVLRGHISKGQLKKLADDPNVLWIEPGPQMKLFDEISSDIVAGEGGVHSTFTQMSGYDGTGVTVAVADSGLDTGEADTIHPDLFGRTTAFLYYGNLADASDEHSHGTHVSGIIAGNAAVGEVDEFDMLYGLGVAPNARIVTQRIFDGVGNYEAPPSFGTLTRDAVQAGAEIGSNSWGDDTQGQYDTSAAEFDALVRDADETVFGDQQYILEFSAGNAGPDSQTIGSPAVGKNVIATGASQNNRLEMLLYTDGVDAMADFSSRGPAADGRIKPDVTAPGTWISSAFSAYAPEDNTWGAISGSYAWMSGTSQAGPHASGAAAVFVQFYRQQHGGTNPSPALVKAALINSAVDMDDSVETEAAPNNDEGWGRIDLTEIIGSERLYQYVDQTERLGPGQVYEHHVLVGIEEAPLKFTLTYTDFPGLPSAALALVNDLDLEVVAPDGRVYHGNRFVDGESIPNVADYDSINNVEGVHLNEPMSGEYIVRVRARRVVEDAIADTPGVLDQDFALVVSGDLLSTIRELDRAGPEGIHRAEPDQREAVPPATGRAVGGERASKQHNGTERGTADVAGDGERGRVHGERGDGDGVCDD